MFKKSDAPAPGPDLESVAKQVDDLLHPVKLGEKYRDSITGVEGTATARVEYLYGCVRIDLEGVDKAGEPKAWIFDEQRLVSVATNEPVKVTATSGGDRQRPSERSQPSREGRDPR